MSLISAEFLTPAYARALRPLSDHRHDHRNPQPFVYRRAPAYGLMVILVVCLWHEPNSQLFDTEAAQTDGNQMPFIACLHHLCVPVTSVMRAAGTESCLSRSFWLCKAPRAFSLSDRDEIFHTVSDGWMSSSNLLHALFCLVCALCTNVCAYACVSWVSSYDAMCWHSASSHRLHLVCEWAAPAADAWLTGTHSHPYIRTTCKPLDVCSFHSISACIHWHMLPQVMPDPQ